MDLSAVPNIIWQAIIAGVVTIVVALIQCKTLIAVNKMAKVANQTHTLVNSAMGNQLKLTAQSALDLAAENPTKINVKKARAAEKMLSEHIVKQTKVDEDKED